MLKENFFFIVSNQIIIPIWNWIFIIIITKNFGLEETGTFLLLLSYVNFSWIFTNYNSDNYISIKSSILKKKFNNIFRNIIFLSFLLSFLIYVAVVIFFSIFSSKLNINFLILSLNIFFGVYYLFQYYFIGLDKPKYFFYRKFFLYFVSICLLIFYNKNLNITELFIWYTITNLILYFFLIYYLFKEKFRIRIKFCKLFYSKIFPIFLSSIFNFFKIRGSMLILSFYLNSYFLGIHGIILRAIDLINTSTLIILKVFYNKMIFLFKKKNFKFFKFKYIIFLFITLIFVNIYQIFLIKFDAIFDNNIFKLNDLIPIILFIFLMCIFNLFENIFNLFFQIKNQNKIILMIILISAAIHLISLQVFTYYLNYQGSLIAITLGSFLTFILNVYFLKYYK